MDTKDLVVMGGQKKRDTLAEMPRFGGRNVQGGEVFPVWLKELFKKVKFDVGDIGVRNKNKARQRPTTEYVPS